MRLLIVEDEKELADGLALLFERSGYTVNICYDGVSGLDEILSGVYDLAVLDIMLPGKDGISVLKTAREQGCRTQVIMLTAKSETMDKVQGLDCGADDYLGKPFATKELLARIRSITRRQTQAKSAVLTFGNLSLDCTTFDLSSPKDSIHLGNKEFQIMELLLANPGQLIATERFMEKIWGYDSEAEINVVWVYLSGLRKKLVKLDANVRIKAARNQGYSLELAAE